MNKLLILLFIPLISMAQTVKKIDTIENNDETSIVLNATNLVEVRTPLSLDLEAIFTEITTPSNPAVGAMKFYAKTDGNFYKLDDLGVESQLGGDSTPTTTEGDLIVRGITEDIRLANSLSNGDFLIVDTSVEGNLKYGNTLQGTLNPIVDGVAYSPTITGFGTTGFSQFSYSISGENIILRGIFEAGSPTAVQARISLPNSYTIKTVGSTNTQQFGTATRGVAEVENNDFRVIADQDDISFGFAVVNSSSYNGLDYRLGNDIVGSGNVIVINAVISINELSSGLDAVVQKKALTAKTVNELSVRGDSAGAVLSENYTDFINGNCVRDSAGVYSCTYHDINITVAMSCVPTAANDNNRYAVISNETSTGFTVYTTSSGGTAVDGNWNVNCSKQDPDTNKNVIQAATLLDTELKGQTKMTNLSTYADDTDAGVGGLVSGDIYKTVTGEIRIKL